MNEKTKPPKPSKTTKPTSSDKAVQKTVAGAASKVVKTKAGKIAVESPAKPAPKPATTRRRKAVDLPKPMLDEGQRAQYVSVAAYYIAERRGFNGSYELADWVQAETQIDNLLREGKLSS